MTMVCPACDAAPLAAETAGAGTADVILSVPTAHCAACIGRIERALQSRPGVHFARVNLSLKRVGIGGTLNEDDAIAVLAAEGYPAYPLSDDILSRDTDPTGRDMLWRLGLAGFAMMNVMLLSVAVWSGASDATRDLFHLISALIAAPVVVYSGQPFFKGAWSALQVGRLNMDVPISLAILLAVIMSLFETLNGGEHAYFDAAVSLTFFLLIGRYLDHRTRASARSAAKELSALENYRAQRLDASGRAILTPISELELGDQLLIPTGMRLPVDGDLVSSSAQLDRSFLTGEADTVTVPQGAALHAGEINLGAPVTMSATAVGEDTTLRRIASLVETAENARNSYTVLADRAAAIYAPAVHLLAFTAFVGWFAYDGDLRHAINVAIAVLIITCPCALGLAVPAVSTAAISRLYNLGFLVKSGSALERLAEVDTVVFDKTGTLTLPGVDTTPIPETDKSVVLALAQNSAHPLSRALAACLADHAPTELAQVTEVKGQGVQAVWDTTPVALGNGKWLGASFDGLGYRVGDRVIELTKIETPRPGAKAAVDGLKQRGFDVTLLSGDYEAAAQAAAADLGIETVIARVSPDQKHRVLEQLKSDGHCVLMIGDGLNDTAALAAAHASLAPSSAIDASRNAADVVLTRESFADLPSVLDVGSRARRLSLQNFGIALSYNCVAVPIALLGFATPLMAALAMSTSSIMVLLNAIRVRKVGS